MSTRGLNRREFVRLAALGLAGGAMGLRGTASAGMMSGGGGMGGGGMGGGGMGGGTSVIDPPAGALFVDPPDIFYSGTPIELTAAESPVSVNGTAARLLAYNGLYPGPTIRARQGDVLNVRLTNKLPYTTATNLLGHPTNHTNLHTHGLHVSPSGNADNMMIMLDPTDPASGAEYAFHDYVYDLGMQEPGALTFYHPHVHGEVAEQFWGGLAGALLIEDDPTQLTTTLLGSYESHVLVLKDLTLSNGRPASYTSRMEYMHGKEGNTVMVSGQVNPTLPIRPGQVQRWRIVNASNARFYNLSLEGHSLYLIGTDGGLLDKPYPLPRILLSPGERVDILVKASTSTKGTSYKLKSLPYDRGGGALQTVTLLTLKYSGSRASDPMPAQIRDVKRLDPWSVPIAKSESLSLSMMGGAGYINGITFTGMDHCAKITSSLGTYEVWDIVNRSGMDHPFHQHVNACQVLSVSGGDAYSSSLYTAMPAWKDTVVIPKMGSVTMLVPVMDYDGMAMFHCHIIEHEDIGMMGVWDIGGMPM